MSTQEPPQRPAEQTDYLDDEGLLHRLGYAQELFRAVGGFGNFAISFTIISILAGCLTSYWIALGWGGPVAIIWGWLLVGGFCILVALAMGEIASSMPTAGGLYYWASRLGSPGWGWFTGWFNLIGQIAVTAAIDFGAAIFWTSLLNLWFDYPNSQGWIFVAYSVIIGLHLLLNLMSIRVNDLLNRISAFWHMIGVLIIAAVLFIVPDQHASAGFVFTETINNSGFSGQNFGDIGFWFVFGLGLLMAQYTITGFDASAHISEETRQASRGAALGMVMSVVVSVIFGFIVLLAVTFAIQDVDGALGAGGFAVQEIWTTALGDHWAEFCLFIACVAQFFCGNASVTSASRMMFAFSRDRAIPGHQLWRRVAGDRVPVFAVIAIVVLAWALMLPTLSNAIVGYAVGTSIAVIGLYIAFVLPIILRYRHGERFERGAWHLGRHYRWIDPLAIAWIALICVLFMMPLFPDGFPWTEGALNWNDVNYAPITVGGALLFFGGWYLISARKWFKGPVRMTDEEVAAREGVPGMAPAGK